VARRPCGRSVSPDLAPSQFCFHSRRYGIVLPPTILRPSADVGGAKRKLADAVWPEEGNSDDSAAEASAASKVARTGHVVKRGTQAAPLTDAVLARGRMLTRTRRVARRGAACVCTRAHVATRLHASQAAAQAAQAGCSGAGAVGCGPRRGRQVFPCAHRRHAAAKGAGGRMQRQRRRRGRAVLGGACDFGRIKCAIRSRVPTARSQAKCRRGIDEFGDVTQVRVAPALPARRRPLRPRC
jgi:hypothetical protein